MSNKVRKSEFQKWARAQAATDIPRQLLYVNVRDWERKVNDIRSAT